MVHLPRRAASVPPRSPCGSESHGASVGRDLTNMAIKNRLNIHLRSYASYN